MALAGTAGTVAAFFLPADFAWNGWNTVATCVDTARYGSEAWSRLAWYGFAACVLYPLMWVLATAVAVVFRRAGSAAWLPTIVTIAGDALIWSLGIVLLSRHETWPEPPVQWLAAVASPLHAWVVWRLANQMRPEFRLFTTAWVGGVPFVLLYAAMAVASARYGGSTVGYALAAVSTMILLIAAIIRPAARQ